MLTSTQEVLTSPFGDPVRDLASAIAAANHIIVLLGAGVSVNAGIPDFRSPHNGMYARLQADPEDIFHVESFASDPVLFYRVLTDVLLGDDGNVKHFMPTQTHFFLKHIKDHGKLLRVYTQNIDGLDCEPVGLKFDVDVIQCHGNLRKIHCSNCKIDQPITTVDWISEVSGFLRRYDASSSSRIPAELRCCKCGGFTKPCVVLFGEPLPDAFTRMISADSQMCDLLIVFGSSLTVFPFAGIPQLLRPGVPQFIITKHSSRQFPGALVINSDCDEVVSKLVQVLSGS